MNQPKEYFASIVEGVMRGEIDENLVTEADDFVVVGASGPNSIGQAVGPKGGGSSGSGSSDGNTNRLNLFALQAAVIVRLVQYKGITRAKHSHRDSPANERTTERA